MIGRRDLAAGALSLPAARAAAQGNWPDRPVTIVVPSAPGGSLDTLTRLLAEGLREPLGQTVVVENRAGAGGAIGADYVAKSPADSNRFLAGAVHHTILPAVQRVPYDSERDLVPVTDIASSPNALIVPAASPVRTVAELVAGLKAGTVPRDYATGGNGTLHHLTGALFGEAAGVELTPIHYRGSAPAITDLVAGRVPFFFETLPSAAQQIRGGTVRAIAVTSATRAPSLPDVPTMTESGFPSIQVETWYGLLGPRGTPEVVAARLRDAVARALATSPMRAAWEQNGVSGGGKPVADFAAMWRSELAAWTARARSARLSPE
ncbi:Bug family tripartite tricarboxylate transporter substrate binding protein [Roseomonas sp. CCTCC AB2023176]|uniref:Bug family tripartite tricarboxylate transporter substrate binding protein n=1 Tax=Roseomonas sp. CCTCC AB2023176 TaxID=3342640 RepID=UPI0035D7509D